MSSKLPKDEDHTVFDLDINGFDMNESSDRLPVDRVADVDGLPDPMTHDDFDAVSDADAQLLQDLDDDLELVGTPTLETPQVAASDGADTLDPGQLENDMHEEDTAPFVSPPKKRASRVPKPPRSKAKPLAETNPVGFGDDAFNPDVLAAVADMPLDIVAVLGRKRMSVKEMAHLRTGSVIEVDTDSERRVDLVASGKTIGKGELVLVDGRLGVRIVKYF